MPLLHVSVKSCTLLAVHNPPKPAMPRVVSILLVSFLAVTGCRETITGPASPIDPVTDPSPSPPAYDIDPLYVKGPAVLAEGSLGRYRAEPFFHPELDRYEWRVFGFGRLTIEPDDSSFLGRLITARPTQAGSVLLTVWAYAHDGRRLAYGEKVVEIPDG